MVLLVDVLALDHTDLGRLSPIAPPRRVGAIRSTGSAFFSITASVVPLTSSISYHVLSLIASAILLELSDSGSVSITSSTLSVDLELTSGAGVSNPIPHRKSSRNHPSSQNVAASLLLDIQIREISTNSTQQ